MRLGLIARADSRGLGIQTRAFHDHMHPTKTLVVNCPSMNPLPLRRDWYPDATWVNGLPTPTDYARWLTGLDAVYTAETPYNHSLFTIATQLGIKTVLHCNAEFLDHIRRPNMPAPTVFACPTRWMWQRIPDPKIHLPVPVDTERFTPQTADKAVNFLHVIGRPAIYDRAGTADLLLALESVHTDITVTLTCQEPGYVPSLIATNNIRLPDNVTLRLSEGDQDNYWDLYTGQHVLVLPRRFGGLCLPMQEACAAGMPVVAPAISPNTDWLPADWLIPATHAGGFIAHTEVDLYTVNHLALAAKIDQLAADHAYYRDATTQALGIAKQLSWENLEPEYRKVLAG